MARLRWRVPFQQLTSKMKFTHSNPSSSLPVNFNWCKPMIFNSNEDDNPIIIRLAAAPNVANPLTKPTENSNNCHMSTVKLTKAATTVAPPANHLQMSALSCSVADFRQLSPIKSRTASLTQFIPLQLSFGRFLKGPVEESLWQNWLLTPIDRPKNFSKIAREWPTFAEKE